MMAVANGSLVSFEVSRSRSLLQQSHRSKIMFISPVRLNSDDHTKKDINFKKLMMSARAAKSNITDENYKELVRN